MKLFAFKIRRDAHTTTPVDIPEHELPIVQELFGEENVQTADGRSVEEFGIGEPSGEVPDPEDEFSRLSAKYGSEAVEEVYGKKASKGLETAMAATKKAASKKPEAK
ncbi:Hypothetical protein HEAR2279 [Herminiimonas arsenicoxydans]|uniref:Uncharacterized protein n=1 Tax=Herminiimonas arsenicoxydans TaxID=204773 RepID=A4G7C5_HERAR|nr:Hypothetical protein HEAR2279 [Herminiimonas arsenicoxydans]